MRGSKISSLAVILAAFGAGKLAIDSLSSKNQVSLDKVQQVKQNSHDYSSEDLEIKSYINSAIETQKQSNLVSESYSNIKEDSEGREKIINENFIETIIFMESSGNPRAESSAGARGLMQIMPKTWREETEKLYGKSLDFDSAFNRETNRQVGESYLNTIEKILSKRIDNWDNLRIEDKRTMIAAAYHGGPYGLARVEGDISKMGPNTREYAEKFEKLMKKD